MNDYDDVGGYMMTFIVYNNCDDDVDDIYDDTDHNDVGDDDDDIGSFYVLGSSPLVLCQHVA